VLLNNEAAAALADLYDVNKDGKISLDEFSARMAGTLGSSLGANTLHQRTCATRARCFEAWHWHLTLDSLPFRALCLSHHGSPRVGEAPSVCRASNNSGARRTHPGD